MTFALIFGLYLSLYVYLFHRGWTVLSGTGFLRPTLLVLYVIFSFCLFLGHSLGKGHHPELRETLSALGSWYLGAFLYLILFTVLIDLFRLANHFLPFFPDWIRENGRRGGYLAFAAVTGLTALLLFAGYLHSRQVRVKTLEIAIDKKADGLSSLNAVFFSDVHVGPFMRVSRLEKIVRTINDLKPDVILIGGDVINEEILPSEMERLPSVLAGLRSRFGVFACTGNHEYFAGIAKSLALLERSRIDVLQDRAVLVDSSFYIAGRSNQSYLGHKEQRAKIREILKDADMRLPIIFLDHQPVQLNEAVEAGVDLQLSGHTHAGQVFPASWINDRLFEIGSGYGRKANTQFYVTSGVGVWAPPARIGTNSEIVHLIIHFQS